MLRRSVVSALLVSIVACAESDDLDAAPSSSGAAGNGGAPVCAEAPLPQKPVASCDVTIDRPPVASSIRHVPEGTTIRYCSNPPSSGDHYPVWAAFREYDHPIDGPYLVHSMEHGAVVLLYKCEAACPEIVEALRAVRDAAADDPRCSGQPTPKRIIIAPSPTLDTKVAAAAWGATYRASCVDTPTLGAFVRDHYAKGPEDFCVAGRDF